MFSSLEKTVSEMSTFASLLTYIVSDLKMDTKMKPVSTTNRFLANKTNICTEFQRYWYYNSICFGQPFCLRQFHPTPGSKRFITTA
jgi:hypothetical protein